MIARPSGRPSTEWFRAIAWTALVLALLFFAIGSFRYLKVAKDKFSEAERRCAAKAASGEISSNGVVYGGNCLREETRRSPFSVTRVWFGTSGAFLLLWLAGQKEASRRGSV